MNNVWQVEYYRSPIGNSPIKKYIDSLEEKTRIKVIRALFLLEEFNTALTMPHVKKLTGTPLWELRIVGSDNIRIFYVAKEHRTFLILHIFKKKTQQTERKEIRVALERLYKY